LEDGAAILDKRISDAVVDGLNGITNSEVLAAYEAYDVYTYWAKADWDVYGSITGSYQVTPGTLGLDNLDILDPNATNVFTCWSGQTASMVAAWLNALGYDARTLKFSANGMIYDELQKSFWNTPAEFNYETGS
jgi:rhodanese-related sulfurtransferase